MRSRAKALRDKDLWVSAGGMEACKAKGSPEDSIYGGIEGPEWLWVFLPYSWFGAVAYSGQNALVGLPERLQHLNPEPRLLLSLALSCASVFCLKLARGRGCRSHHSFGESPGLKSSANYVLS